ncbi:hypothetical protein ACSSS7_001604 [Eimeria intestinalis]
MSEVAARMSVPDGNEVQLPLAAEGQPAPVLARTPAPTKVKGPRIVRGLPLHQRKLFRNLARQTPRVQGLTFDHNQIRWISYWKNEQNKQVQKHFPVSRFGFFGARKLALEERNRVQGWPLDTDEAATAIEKLKVDVAAFEGREYGTNPNADESQPHDSDDEAPNTQVVESALMRSMREDDDEGCDRQRTATPAPRKRATRPRNAKRSFHALTQTDRGERGSGGERDALSSLHPSTRQDRINLEAARGAAEYTEFLARAFAMAAAQQAEQTALENQRTLQRHISQTIEPWTRHFKADELAEALLSLNSGRSTGPLFLDGGGDRQSSGSSRLVSMASSFEEAEPLGDSSMTGDSTLQEPDALRDLLNSAVTHPTNTVAEWEAESANSSVNVDVSRPTRDPRNPRARNI